MRWLMLLPVVVCFLSCTEKKNETYAIGKYVYLDAFYRLHINKNCWRIGDNVEFIDTAQLYSKDGYKYCNDCFTDSTYEHIQVIMKRDADRKWLYEKFIEGGADMPSYNSYVQKLSEPTKRELLYEYAVKGGLDVGTYEEFSKMLGY